MLIYLPAGRRELSLLLVESSYYFMDLCYTKCLSVKVLQTRVQSSGGHNFLHRFFKRDTASRYKIHSLSIVLSILKSSNIVYMSVHRELSVIRTPRSINPNNTGGTGGHGQISLITFFISVQMMLNCIMRQC